MKYFFLSFLVTLLASGCATTPVSTSNAKPVPQKRILSTVYSTQAEATGKVIVKRDKGFGGSACSTRVYVDGEPIADLRVGEKIVIYLPIGEHIIGANPNGICGGGLSETQITAKEEKPVALRIRYGSNGDFSIQQTAT